MQLSACGIGSIRIASKRSGNDESDDLDSFTQTHLPACRVKVMAMAVVEIKTDKCSEAESNASKYNQHCGNTMQSRNEIDRTSSARTPPRNLEISSISRCTIKSRACREIIDEYKKGRMNILDHWNKSNHNNVEWHLELMRKEC
jgi:hypothetical protein